MPGRTLKKLLQGRGEGKQEEQAYFLAINFTLEQRASQTLTAPSMLTQSRKGRLDLVQLEIARLSIRNFYFYHSISLPFNIFGFFGVFFFCRRPVSTHAFKPICAGVKHETRAADAHLNAMQNHRII